MANTAFTEVSPWAGTLKRGRTGRVSGEAGLSIGEPASCAMGLLARRTGAAADLARAAGAFGLDLPTAPRWTQARGVTVLWAGPGQWLLRRSGTFADLETELSTLAPYGALIDQSQARAVLTLAGPRVRDVLAKGFEIDLHPRAFKAGDVALTVASGISVVLWQIDELPSYAVAVPRSMARSFWEWLAEAAAEYGCLVGDGG